MATVKFTLRQPVATVPQPIYLVFRYQKQKLVFSTGAKVLPKFWSAEKQRIKNTSNVPDRDALNGILSDLEAAANSFYVEAIKNRAFSTDALKQHLEEYTGRTKTPDTKTRPLDLFGYIRQFIEGSKTRTDPNTGKQIHPRTIKKYLSTLHILEAFAATYKRKVDFETIDYEFHTDFTQWLQNRPHHRGNGYTTNGIGKHIATVKGFLNAATLDGATTATAFKSSRFNVPKEDSDSIYLNEQDLQALFTLDLSQIPRLERVRDLFLIGCWTGLRFSDFSRIAPDENIKDGWLSIEQYKTGRPVVIPVHYTVQAILDKYGHTLPDAISNQKFNDYIKEVCQMAGLVERVQKGITRAGQRITTTYQKWELVSSHTARRSFATNLYKDGCSTITIMQVTGHRTEKAFLKYIKATPAEHAKILKLHWERKNESFNHLTKVA